MPLNFSTVHSLRRVFQQAFVVHDIAESLVSFDGAAAAADIRTFMSENLESLLEGPPGYSE